MGAFTAYVAYQLKPLLLEIASLYTMISAPRISVTPAKEGLEMSTNSDNVARELDEYIGSKPEHYVWINGDVSPEIFPGASCLVCGRNFTLETWGWILFDMDDLEEPDMLMHAQCFNRTATKVDGVSIAYAGQIISKVLTLPGMYRLSMRAKKLCEFLDEDTLADLQQLVYQGLLDKPESNAEITATYELCNDIFDELKDLLIDLEEDSTRSFDDIVSAIGENKSYRKPLNNGLAHNEYRSSQLAPHENKTRHSHTSRPHVDGVIKCKVCETEVCNRRFCTDHDHSLYHMADTGHDVTGDIETDLKNTAGVVCTS